MKKSFEQNLEKSYLKLHMIQKNSFVLNIGKSNDVERVAALGFAFGLASAAGFVLWVAKLFKKSPQYISPTKESIDIFWQLGLGTLMLAIICYLPTFIGKNTYLTFFKGKKTIQIQHGKKIQTRSLEDAYIVIRGPFMAAKFGSRYFFRIEFGKKQLKKFGFTWPITVVDCIDLLTSDSEDIDNTKKIKKQLIEYIEDKQGHKKSKPGPTIES